MIGCKSQKYQLESSPILTLKEGYYVVIPPAIVEGVTSVKASLKFDEFDKGEIELIGFYFRNNYISMKAVSDPYAIEGGVLKKENSEETKIPFSIEPYEVVLSYKEKGKLKYAKFNIKKKAIFDNIPR
jgi:hypothetical protein